MSTDALPDPVATALDRHDAFEPGDAGYALTTTVLDATVTATEAPGERDGSFTVRVRLPTLDAAVADERVAPVVEDGWFETLERRLADVFCVARTSQHDEPRVVRDEDEVRVDLAFVAWDAREGVEDAKALVEFVEGTFAQGLVPGYTYRGPAAQLLDRSARNGRRSGGSGSTGDGVPPL